MRERWSMVLLSCGAAREVSIVLQRKSHAVEEFTVLVGVGMGVTI